MPNTMINYRKFRFTQKSLKTLKNTALEHGLGKSQGKKESFPAIYKTDGNSKR